MFLFIKNFLKALGGFVCEGYKVFLRVWAKVLQLFKALGRFVGRLAKGDVPSREEIVSQLVKRP